MRMKRMIGLASGFAHEQKAFHKCSIAKVGFAFLASGTRRLQSRACFFPKNLLAKFQVCSYYIRVSMLMI